MSKGGNILSVFWEFTSVTDMMLRSASNKAIDVMIYGAVQANLTAG